MSSTFDRLSAERRSENMRRIKSKDTNPELQVRQLIYSLGYRYRLHRKDLPGRPDLVFGPKRKVIFVHGCFWHGHDDLDCRDARLPKSNQTYWVAKLERNKQRDAAQIAALQSSGWQVLVLWECHLKQMSHVKAEIVQFLESRLIND